MDSSSEVIHLRHIIELCKTGSCLPVGTLEALIAADAGIEPLLVDLVQSRALTDDSWAPLWAIVALGERKSPPTIPVLLEAMGDGNDLIHEGVEFALLRFGAESVGPILEHLDNNPGMEGRVHLYSVLARSRDPRAIDYLINQLRCDEDCMAGVAWSLAETRDARAVAAIESIVARFGKRDPELKEALEAAMSQEPLENPLLEDWRHHWSWHEESEDDEDGAEAGSDEPETGMADADSESPSFLPRCYDVDCPACHSRLEYDVSDGSVKVLRGKKAASS